MKSKICMIVQDRAVRGGIAAVTEGYYGSELEKKYHLTFIESYRDGSQIQKLLKGIHSYIQFLCTCLVDRPEIVHIHSSFGMSFYRSLPFIQLAKIFHVKILNHVHGADFTNFYKNSNNSKKHLIAKFYNKCDAFIVLSPEWKQKLSELVNPSKIFVVENYSQVQAMTESMRQSRLKSKSVLFLGEIGERKGCFDIPRVASQVLRKVPDAIFNIGGTGARDDVKRMQDEIDALGLNHAFAFRGWIRGQQRSEILKTARVFFLPTYNEGMPMSIFDAMGYSLPIVSTVVGGIPNQVQDKKNGFLTNPGDIAGFADALVKILQDDELALDLGKHSYELAKNKYSLHTHLMKIENIYSFIIKRGNNK